MKTIMIDMDGVLVDLVSPTLEYLNETFDTVVEPEDIHTFDIEENFHRITGILKKDVEQELEWLWKQPGFWSSLEPNYGAVTAIKELAKDYTILIVTRTWRKSISCAGEKYEWCKRRFNPLMKERKVQFFAVGSAKKSMLKADYLIDDAIHEIEDAQKAGINPIIYNQPWNKIELKIPHDRMDSWLEIRQFFLSEGNDTV